MKFVKRLVILSGEYGKGTLNLERNAYGVSGRLKLFGSDLKTLDLVMRIDGKTYTRSVKDNAGFSLEGQESADSVQAAVFEDGILIMYGTNESKRLLAADAQRFAAYIKKEDKPLFSTRGRQEGKIIKLSYGVSLDEAASAENCEKDCRDEVDYLTEKNPDIKLDYAAEKKSDNIDLLPDKKTGTSGGKNTDIKQDARQNVRRDGKPFYEDERIAGENFYKESDYEAIGRAAEKIRSIKMEGERFSGGYSVLPSDLTRAFLTGMATGQNVAKSESVKAVRNEVAKNEITRNEAVKKESAPSQKEFNKEINATSGIHKEQIFKPAVKFKASMAQKKVLNIFGAEGKTEKFKTQAESRQDEDFFSFYQNEGFSEAAAEKSEALKHTDGRKNTAPKSLKNAFNSSASANSFNTGASYFAAQNTVQNTVQNGATYSVAQTADNTRGAAQRVSSLKADSHVNARAGTFFERNGDEIERLFKGTREDVLEKLLPGSRWVRINYDNSGRFYVIGLIGKEFLCYGVPAEYTPQPPEELKGYCWWLPLTPDKPEGKGYWIMYQNLVTGETVYPKQN